jgi:hypothetical protein
VTSLEEEDPVGELPWPSAVEPPPELSLSIRTECTKGLTPKPCCTLRRRIMMSIGISGMLFAVLLAIGWMRHPPKAAIGLALLGAAVWGVVQALVLLAGCGRPPGKRGYPLLRWLVTVVVVFAFFVQLTIFSTSHLDFNEFLVAPRSLRSTLVCGFHALLFGGLGTAALLFIWRQTDPFTPRLSGAVMGLAGGLVGAISLDMVCTSREATHLWLAHGATLATLVVLGWVLGRRCLTP